MGSGRREEMKTKEDFFFLERVEKWFTHREREERKDFRRDEMYE